MMKIGRVSSGPHVNDYALRAGQKTARDAFHQRGLDVGVTRNEQFCVMFDRAGANRLEQIAQAVARAPHTARDNSNTLCDLLHRGYYGRYPAFTAFLPWLSSSPCASPFAAAATSLKASSAFWVVSLLSAGASSGSLASAESSLALVFLERRF